MMTPVSWESGLVLRLRAAESCELISFLGGLG